MTQAAAWRTMRRSDLAAVEAIAAEVHPGFFEGPAIFAERLALYPQGQFILDRDGTALGYFITHPYGPDALPALDTLLGALPQKTTTYYLHDLALLPEARGLGGGRSALALVELHARTSGFGELALCAVNGSAPYWQRLGFETRDVPALGEKLAGYEAAARYMTRSIEPS